MVEQRYAAEQLFGKMSDMLAEYFELFADKPCCALDMKLFLEFVKPAHERRTLATKLMNGLGLSSATLPGSVSIVAARRFICNRLTMGFLPSLFAERANATTHLYAADRPVQRGARDR